jgi:hypothetical protein
VRRAAKVLDFDAGEGSCPYARTVVQDAWMGDQGHIYVLVCAGLEKTYLAASDAFFAWCAEDEDFAG